MSKRIRLALADQAYEAGTVRLIGHDLAGCEYLVTTWRGLFAINADLVRPIAYGLYYGLTIRDDVIYAFEACDRPRYPTHRGRIVRFYRDGDHIVDTDVFATGLDNNTHQIDFIDGRLCVVDTGNQRVLRYPEGGDEPEILYPIPGGEERNWDRGYVHVNSLVAAGDEILLVLHNGADKTGRPSEIARFDRDWCPIGRLPLDGLGCHNLVALEDGTFLSCGSMAGELIGTGGLKLPICDMMTRGLSVDADRIVVGGSAFAERADRDEAEGAVFFLDRDYRLLSRLALPSAPMDIRRIDGRDRSLSDYRAGSDTR